MSNSLYYNDIYTQKSDGTLNADHKRILNFSDPLIICSYALDSENQKILGNISDKIVIHFIHKLMKAHGGRIDPHKDLNLISAHKLSLFATNLIMEMKK